ncbi:hypothetical protein BSK65_11215 [Paenibacillus odorifer]|uniref:Uncharacterized protein n=1 Tax=Paenibacillus odorifer TaxID=189426 RepID=A0A1R0ZHZ6_9BACL|nr:hypothetical protein BSK65_11215 [Paenibacillus odorifer]
MINFLKSKSFLVSTVLFSLIFIINIAVTDSSTEEIALAVLKSLLAGVICGFVFGGILYLIQKRNKRIN